MVKLNTETMFDAMLEYGDLNPDEYIVMDFDTTGYDKTDSITNIVLLSTEGGVLLQSLVDPLKPIPTHIEKSLGITNEMVNRQPIFDELAPQILACVGNRTIIFWNAEFGRQILQSELLRASYSVEEIPQKWACPMLWYRTYVLGGKGSFPRLDNAAIECGVTVPKSGNHSLDDCRKILAMIKALLSGGSNG